jgi:hypothetical protein
VCEGKIIREIFKDLIFLDERGIREMHLPDNKISKVIPSKPLVT